jgi:hypothetical protein
VRESCWVRWAKGKGIELGHRGEFWPRHGISLFSFLFSILTSNSNFESKIIFELRSKI